MLKTTLEKLISFKSLSDNHREQKRLFSYVKQQIRGLPLEIGEHTVNGSPSLIITTQETKHPILWLQAHIDVVPGSEEVFKPKVKGRRLYGRGAYDMKYASACYIELLKDLKNSLPKLDFGVMLTSDEEIGGKNGVRAMIEKGYRSDACFLPDAGKEWNLEKAAKGVFRITVTSKGKAAHGSRPWEGNNAIDALSEFLLALKEQFPLSEENDHYHNTMNVGIIRGGEAVNAVPDFAQAEIDLRFTHIVNKRKLQKIIQSTKKRFSGISFQETMFAASTSIDPDNFYIQEYQKVVMDVIGKKVKFSYSHGATDARFFSEVGIPTILLRPKGGGHHGEKEWVDLKSLDEFYAVLKEFVTRVAVYKGKRRGFRIFKMLKGLWSALRNRLRI